MKQVIVKDKSYAQVHSRNKVLHNFPKEVKNYKTGEFPKENKIYNVLDIIPYSTEAVGPGVYKSPICYFLYFIKDKDTKQVYIMEVNGIEFVEERRIKSERKIKS